MDAPFGPGSRVHVRIDLETKTIEEGHRIADEILDKYGPQTEQAKSGVGYTTDETMDEVFWYPEELDEEEEIVEPDPGPEVDDEGGMSEHRWEGADDRD